MPLWSPGFPSARSSRRSVSERCDVAIDQHPMLNTLDWQSSTALQRLTDRRIERGPLSISRRHRQHLKITRATGASRARCNNVFTWRVASKLDSSTIHTSPFASPGSLCFVSREATVFASMPASCNALTLLVVGPNPRTVWPLVSNTSRSCFQSPLFCSEILKAFELSTFKITQDP